LSLCLIIHIEVNIKDVYAFQEQYKKCSCEQASNLHFDREWIVFNIPSPCRKQEQVSSWTVYTRALADMHARVLLASDFVCTRLGEASLACAWHHQRWQPTCSFPLLHSVLFLSTQHIPAIVQLWFIYVFYIDIYF